MKKWWIYLLFLLTLVSVVSAQYYYTDTGFGIGDIADFYNAYPYWFDFFISLIIFVSLGRIVFGGRAYERGSKGLTIGIALALSFGLILWESRTGFNLGDIWIFALLILVFAIGMAIYRYFKNIGVSWKTLSIISVILGFGGYYLLSDYIDSLPIFILYLIYFLIGAGIIGIFLWILDFLTGGKEGRAEKRSEKRSERESVRAERREERRIRVEERKAARGSGLFGKGKYGFKGFSKFVSKVLGKGIRKLKSQNLDLKLAKIGELENRLIKRGAKGIVGITKQILQKVKAQKERLKQFEIKRREIVEKYRRWVEEVSRDPRRTDSMKRKTIGRLEARMKKELGIIDDYAYKEQLRLNRYVDIEYNRLQRFPSAKVKPLEKQGWYTKLPKMKVEEVDIKEKKDLDIFYQRADRIYRLIEPNKKSLDDARLKIRGLSSHLIRFKNPKNINQAKSFLRRLTKQLSFMESEFIKQQKKEKPIILKEKKEEKKTPINLEFYYKKFKKGVDDTIKLIRRKDSWAYISGSYNSLLSRHAKFFGTKYEKYADNAMNKLQRMINDYKKEGKKIKYTIADIERKLKYQHEKVSELERERAILRKTNDPRLKIVERKYNLAKTGLRALERRIDELKRKGWR